MISFNRKNQQKSARIWRCICYTVGLCLYFCVNLTAQSPTYYGLTVEDGLPSNNVYFIHQDKVGLLWLATENGLCQYNGSKFTYFDHTALGDNDIIGLHVDSNDRIWMWNMSGELAYIENGKIQLFDFGLEFNALKIVGFRVDSKGNYWLSTLRSGVWKYKPTEKIAKRIFLRKAGLIYTIEENSKGNIYLDCFCKIEQDSLKHLLKANNYVIRKMPTGRLICHSWSNPEVVEITDETSETGKILIPKDFPLIKGKVLNVFEDNDKTLWFTTQRQLFGIKEDGTWINDGKPLFSNLAINYFLQDKEGNYWLAIKGKGLRMYPSFEVLTYDQYNSALQGETVLSISSNANGSIFIGQEKGKASILKNNRFLNHQFETEVGVYGVLALENENFWVASNTILEVTENLAIVTIYQKQHKPKVLFEDTDNLKRYSGFFWGVYKNSLNDSPIQGYLRKNRLDIDRTYAIEKDYQSKRLWFGKMDGLEYLKGNSVVKFPIKELKNQPWVSKIAFGKDGNMWVGTYEQGVLWLKYGRLLRQYNTTTGMSDNHCNTMILDGDILWVATNKGINKIELQNDKIDIINKLDGLPNNEINALHQIYNKFYVGTSSGLTVFDKRKIGRNTQIPKVLITNVKIIEQDTTLHEVYDLAYNQNNIRVEFTGLNYRNQGKNKYKYRMLGVDTTWMVTTSNTVSFPALAPDDYKFEVIAVNEDGVESKTPASIYFYINLPFWRTVWFNAALVFGLSGFMFSISYLWFYQYRQKNRLKDELKHKVSELTMQALQAQMNPHFVFNALNGIQRFILSGEKREAMTYLSKFARLIRLIFEYSKQNKISLTSEMEFLKLYLELEKFRFKDKVEVILKADTFLSEDAIFIPPLLVQPVVENAFKHGLLHKKEGGILKVHFKQESDTVLKCTITDNGIGRKRAEKIAEWKPKEYRSSGLETTKNRLNLLNQNLKEPLSAYFTIIDLEDEAKQSIGTKVELLILIGKREDIRIKR